MNTTANNIVKPTHLVAGAATVLLVVVIAAVAQNVPPDVAKFVANGGDRHVEHVVHPDAQPSGHTWINTVQQKLQAASERYARLAASMEQRNPKTEAAAAENLRILRQELQRLIDELPEKVEAPTTPAPSKAAPGAPATSLPHQPVKPAESRVNPEDKTKKSIAPSQPEPDAGKNGDQDDDSKPKASTTVRPRPAPAAQNTPFDAARLVKLAKRLEQEASELRRQAQRLQQTDEPLTPETQQRVKALEEAVGTSGKESRSEHDRK